MVNKSPRELLEVPSAWSIPQLMDSLAAALNGEGPALAFAPSRFNSVPENVAVVIPSSGSTGAPKEVALSAAALRASARSSNKYLQAQSGDSWSLRLPTNHIAGVNVLMRALELGSRIVETDYQFTALVPTQLFRALNEGGELLANLQSATAVLVGGAATQEELLERAAVAKINVVTTYGMSEMSGGCVYDGHPLEGVEIDIREDGRIALRGAMQAECYLGVAEPLSDAAGWFLTNDAGALVDGKLVVTGRIDDQIISGGEKISLSAIDYFLNTNLENEYMSCAIPSVEWGQQLCLASSSLIDEHAISELLRERFGRHAVPKLFLSEIELPRTTIEKADRKRLAQIFEMIQP